jgi:predicted metal-binding membrane protein
LPVDDTLEIVVRRDRLIVVTGLVAVITLAWIYLLRGAGMGEMTMMTPGVWTIGYSAVMFVMWWVMMVAMMLPSAAQMILVFATLNRKQRESGHPYVNTAVFVAGYLAIWAGFSLVAVILQWVFQRAEILSPMLAARNQVFAGILLLAAGVYQLTPIKQACLRQCRSPQTFISTQWRRGSRGALYMGLVHGAFCVGCCWFLMGLLFFGGVMNFYWIVGLAVFVLLEKTVPAGHWFGYATGVALIVWGVWVLVKAF